MRDRFASLTSRLVLTAVALVAAVSVLIGGATALAMESYLTNQVDQDVLASVKPLTDRPGPRADGGPYFTGRNQGPGTLNAFLTDGASQGAVLSRTPGEERELPAEVLEELGRVPTDGEVHEVRVAGFGTYRVVAAEATLRSATGVQRGVLVTGLPTADVDDAVASLIWREALFAMLGILAAAAASAVVVRRQLRPLREVAATAHAVAELPLASGEIDLSERVPDHLTDERSEVGQVGAALNTLLAHVETSLEARQRSEQQVRQFVADASHELRTPLATIAGYTQLARRRPDDTEASATALAKVEDESTRMTGLVEDLLLLARLDSGRPVAHETVDLTRLLLEAVSDARVLAPDHQWRLELPDEAVEVTGDGERLHQVVTNLLTNARKHTPPGTTVTVAADAAGFTVRDDGPGLPDGLAQRAFERFTRGDGSRVRGPDGGSGLGLALVEAIVTAHGGTVSLTSLPGGTAVRVELPS